MRDRNIMEVNGHQSEYWGKIMGATYMHVRLIYEDIRYFMQEHPCHGVISVIPVEQSLKRKLCGTFKW